MRINPFKAIDHLYTITNDLVPRQYFNELLQTQFEKIKKLENRISELEHTLVMFEHIMGLRRIHYPAQDYHWEYEKSPPESPQAGHKAPLARPGSRGGR